MKKMLVIGMVSLMAVSGLGMTAVEAKGKHHHNHNNHNNYQQNYNYNNQEREDARYVLRRTGNVLQRAQDLARDRRDRWGRKDGWGNNHHRQSGMRDRKRFRGLGVAFDYQDRAIELYNQGNYQSAIHYSLQARAVALRVIDRLNNSNGWDNWRDDDDYRNCDMNRHEMDSRESGYWDRRPRGNEFEINWHEHDDDDVVNFHIELNF